MALRPNPAGGRRRGFVDPAQYAQVVEATAKHRAETAQTLDKLRRQEMALAARDDLMKFVQYTMPDPAEPEDPTKSLYKAAPFHRAIARALQKAEADNQAQLILCMPPRHGKTQLATKHMAAWFSGRHPEENVAVASYSDTMAEDFGADTRAIMATKQFKQVFPNHRLRRGGASKSNIQTEQGGRLVFVGVGGALTGRGAHLLLIDDAFKDFEDARSKAIRDQAWNWFTKVAMTRRMGRKLVVITMTRWHSDDIIGRLTDPENPSYPGREEASKWKIIRLPAIAEHDDPAGRHEGEALWPDGPDKFDLGFLRSQQRIDPLGFAALYQQRPTVADGVLFRREAIQRYRGDDVPDNLRYYCASDHAVATGQRNDFTVLIKIGIDTQDNIYVLECTWDRLPTDRAVESMITMAGGERRPLLWWAGRDHITKSIGPFLRKRMAETGTWINIRELTPIGDKEQRAQSIAARVANGKVFFPIGPMWAERAIDEMLAFPNGTHDDFVDALACIGQGLGSQFAAPTPRVPDKLPAFGTLGWVKYNDEHLRREKSRTARGF